MDLDTDDVLALDEGRALVGGLSQAEGLGGGLVGAAVGVPALDVLVVSTSNALAVDVDGDRVVVAEDPGQGGVPGLVSGQVDLGAEEESRDVVLGAGQVLVEQDGRGVLVAEWGELAALGAELAGVRLPVGSRFETGGGPGRTVGRLGAVVEVGPGRVGGEQGLRFRYGLRGRRETGHRRDGDGRRE